MQSPGQNLFQLAFQVSPIILTGGIATNIPGGGIPILVLTQAAGFATGLLSGNISEITNPDEYFAQFLPMPGATLVDNDIGTYPFANQQTAANAIITKPLVVSLKMVCPWRQPGDAWLKLATMTALQSGLQQHNTTGGTYTIVTPSFIYTNCLMTAMRDISAGDRQWQFEWQIDFVQPLLTLAQAAAAQNQLLASITNGSQITGDPPTATNLASTVGAPSSLAQPTVLPAAQSLLGAGVSGPPVTLNQ